VPRRNRAVLHEIAVFGYALDPAPEERVLEGREELAVVGVRLDQTLELFGTAETELYIDVSSEARLECLE